LAAVAAGHAAGSVAGKRKARRVNGPLIVQAIKCDAHTTH
jgi:hypothetical protein